VVDRVPILYIAGSGRSGTTILGQTLAEIPGWILCGELRLGIANLVANHLCGCGVPLHDCPFWRVVIENAFGTFDLAVLNHAAKLGGHLSQNQHTLIHLNPLKTTHLRREIAEYSEILSNLYRSILTVSNGELIIDTSKSPAYYLTLLTSPYLDVYTLHTIRDSRGVVFSNKRKKLGRGDSHHVRYMPRQGAFVTSIGWNLKNLFIDLLTWRSKQAIRLRYEDFVADPMRLIGRAIDLTGSKQHPPHLRNGTIEMGTHHTVAGNPVRFNKGAIQLRLDNEWRSGMTPLDRAVVTALTWPMLAAYGYLGRDP
jgi:sulfotransferase family protein